MFQEITEDDEKALEQFMSKNPPARRTLADIIQEKLTEKQTELQSQMSGKTMATIHWLFTYYNVQMNSPLKLANKLCSFKSS